MRIAVTGTTGFIGRYVVNELLHQGHDVLAVGRSAPREHCRLTFVKSDLLVEDNYSWIDEHRPSHLVHLAWYAEHGKFWNSPSNLNWCDATVRLIEEFCKKEGQRIVVAGTCAEYDWSFGYCRESVTPINPATLYGVAKDSARRMAEKICQHRDVQLLWGRVFVPFGPGENPRRLIPSVVAALLGWREPFHISTGQWRDFLSVECVAGALVFLLTTRVTGVCNVCSGIPVQLGDLIQRLAMMLDMDPEPLLRLGTERKDSPHLLVGDNTALLEAGWKPEQNLTDRLQHYATYIAEDIRSNGNKLRTL